MSDLGQGNQDWVQNIFGNIPSRLAKCNSAKLCDCDVGWVVARLWLPCASSQQWACAGEGGLIGVTAGAHRHIARAEWHFSTRVVL